MSDYVNQTQHSHAVPQVSTQLHGPVPVIIGQVQVVVVVVGGGLVVVVVGGGQGHSVPHVGHVIVGGIIGTVVVIPVVLRPFGAVVAVVVVVVVNVGSGPMQLVHTVGVVVGGQQLGTVVRRVLVDGATDSM